MACKHLKMRSIVIHLKPSGPCKQHRAVLSIGCQQCGTKFRFIDGLGNLLQRREDRAVRLYCGSATIEGAITPVKGAGFLDLPLADDGCGLPSDRRIVLNGSGGELGSDCSEDAFEVDSKSAQ